MIGKDLQYCEFNAQRGSKRGWSFYRLIVVEDHLFRFWGIVGGDGKNLHNELFKYTDAVSLMTDLITEKLADGYEEVTPGSPGTGDWVIGHNQRIDAEFVRMFGVGIDQLRDNTAGEDGLRQIKESEIEKTATEEAEEEGWTTDFKRIRHNE